MSEKHGVENIKLILSVLVEAGNVAEMVQKSDSWVAKALALAPIFDELMAVVKLDLKALDAERKDLSDEEKAELIAFAAEKYDIADDVMEAKVEAGIMLAIEVADTIGKVVDYSKGLRKG